MPLPTSNLQVQEYGYSATVPQGTWRWKTRIDVSQATPQYTIRDVISPFGLLRDSIPIPGTVVQAMSESITTLQAAFAPSILVSPTTLTFTVDQGRGFSDPQVVTVTNNGVYGSLLAATVTSDSAFMTVTPANVGALPFNVSGQISVAVDSSELFATESPYSANVTLQDTTATNNPQTIPVTIVVRPLSVIALSPTTMTFNVTANVDGTFPPVPSQSFQLQNTGPSGAVLSYQIAKLIGNSPWLASFTPVFGTVDGGSAQTITVVVQPVTNMQPGTYTETLRVSGYSSNSFVDLPITLNVSCAP